MSQRPPPNRRAAARRRRVIRRRRIVGVTAAVLLVVVVAVGVALGARSGNRTTQGATSTTTTSATGTVASSANGSATSGPRTSPSTSSSPASANSQGSIAAAALAAVAAHRALPAAESGLVPWSLAAPLSRQVVVPGATAGQLVVVGGLTSGSATTAAVSTLTVPGGTQAPAGSIATPTHDAAGTVLGGRVLVFGGGAQATVATVQSFPLRPGTSAGGAGSGAVVGQLPQPRSDAAAVTVGATAYVLGGYDGTRADPQVLATNNGSTFRVVGSLPQPVRYPAVAVLGTNVYVFGGEVIGGGPTDDIQRLDTRTGHLAVVGHLPQPLEAASALTLGGVLYVAGGSTGGSGAAADSSAIYAFDPRTGHALLAGHLQAPVANAAAAATGNTGWLIGGESGTTPTANVQMLEPNARFGLAGKPGAGSPYYGEKLLVADRGNNRLLVLDDTGAIVWDYPNPPTMPPPAGPKGFYFPDDSFFLHHGTAIISNQEENETIVQIGYPSGKILWSYGHPAQIGSAPGYLHEPDDAYILKNGDVTVSDSDNCRILTINPSGAVVAQVGTTGVCTHTPGSALASPNGDTPLPNGNFLISETKGSYISEYTPTGKLVWTTHVAIGYPSDPQVLGPDLYLTANYENPGGFVEFNRAGQILYQYQAANGVNRLNQPSLVELVPSGVFMTNDDFRDRMAAIDPVTQALVWDYGVPDQPGTAPGYLNIPDGFDLLNPDGSTPTHPQTG